MKPGLAEPERRFASGNRTTQVSQTRRGARRILAFLVGVLFFSGCVNRKADAIDQSFEILCAGTAEAGAALANRRTTSGELVTQYLARIDREKDINAIISINPSARRDAKRLDDERAQGRIRGPLHGIPIIVKDNIDVAGVATTAGSLALLDNVPIKDAPLVRRLTGAGAIILAKANLSEWANIRSRWSTSGWSAAGGLVRNPHAPDRSACGSSSGSAVAVAASLAVAAIGTETDGSITCPAAVTGLVGIKPTVGLISRTGIIPISSTQDTPGPMTRTVMDAAMLLTVMAGTDPADAATREADAHRTDYARGLRADALKGARLGVLRFLTGYSPKTDTAFEAALETARQEGAMLVEIKEFDFGDIGANEQVVLLTELKIGLNNYLGNMPKNVKTRSLADVIAFNRNEPREMRWFGQDLFEQAEGTAGIDDPIYTKARMAAQKAARTDGIDALLRDNNVSALVAPTTGPAWTIDLVNGDRSTRTASRLPAVAGYPHVTLPMGNVEGLPVGLSIIGPAWSEQLLLSLAYAFEGKLGVRPENAKAPTAQTGR